AIGSQFKSRNRHKQLRSNKLLPTPQVKRQFTCETPVDLAIGFYQQNLAQANIDQQHCPRITSMTKHRMRLGPFLGRKLRKMILPEQFFVEIKPQHPYIARISNQNPTLWR